jgi:ribonuclease HII
VACALCFDSDNMPDKEFLIQIGDSKKLSEKKREKLFDQLIKFSV